MTSCVAVVDDHQLFAAALAAALRAEGYEVVTPLQPSTSSLRSVELAVLAASPSVVLLDLELHGIGSGCDLVAPFVAGGASVVVVSASDDDVAIGRCLERGAAGWLPKTSAIERLLDAVQAVLEGRPVLPLAERERLCRLARLEAEARRRALEPFSELSPREASVLSALMEGQTVGRIAARCYVSEATVRSQVRGILTKLGARSQLEAVALAVKVHWSAPGAQRSERGAVPPASARAVS